MNNYDEIKKLYDNDVNPNWETSIKNSRLKRENYFSLFV